jgi:hypothetical protein
MPFDPSSIMKVYVTNSGSENGDIFVSTFDDQGTVRALGKIGEVTAGTITNISTVIRPLLADLGTPDGARLALTITVAAPGKAIYVWSNYVSALTSNNVHVEAVRLR